MAAEGGLAPGVSIIVPVRNGERLLDAALRAIRAQAWAGPFEVIVVEDGSDDDSLGVAARHAAADPRVRVVAGPRRGAAAAINAGIRASRYPVVAQIDQDVIVDPGWIAALCRTLAEPGVAAAQGIYAPERDAPLFPRVMGLDLAQRYARLRGRRTDHVCTGNVAYRVEALRAVGLFDEELGYGYDNDLSYRLVAAGFRLRICPEAVSRHRWRDGLRGYLTQQYGFGYGRLDLVLKHRRRAAGDAVSPSLMMVHPIVLALVLALSAWAAVRLALGMPAGVSAWAAAGGLLALLAERTLAGVRAAVRFRDPVALTFPAVHLLRDVAWVAACAVWMVRRATGRPAGPGHSMRPRLAEEVIRARDAGQSAGQFPDRPTK